MSEDASHPPRMALNWKGPFCGVTILLTAYFGSILCLLPFLAAALFHPKIWRYWVDRWVGFWTSYPVALLELVHGSKIQVSGDEILSDEPAIIIMNHRTRLDWLYFWSALYKMNPKLLITEKISLKSNLKKIPGAGWAMQCNNFMFLDRKASDLQIIEESIEFFSRLKTPYQTLLFPEGTDLSDYNREKSRLFAKEHGLPDLDFLLQPRTKGLVHMFSSMRKHNYLSCVYDVTVAYGDAIIASEVDFAKGNCPQDIRFHVRRYSLSDLPEVDDEIGLWCQKLWLRKDQMLRTFYENPNPPSERNIVSIIQKIEENNPIHPNDSKRGADKTWPDNFSGIRYVCLWLSFVIWLYGISLWTYVTLSSSYFWIYIVLSSVTFLCFLKFYNGLELLIVRRFLANVNRKVE